MKSLLIGTTGSAITAGTTQYEPFITQASTNSWSSSLTAATQTPVPHALTLDRLRVKVATAPGVGKNLVIVVLKNGVASALTCTISGTATTAQDLTHTVSYAAGDTITLQATLDTGGTAFGTIYWTARQDASGAFAVLGAITSASAGFYPVMGSIGSAGTSGDTGVVVPCAGTIQSFYVNSSASAGNFTVYLNAVAQTLTTGVMGAATANDTTHSFAVVAGDRVLVRNTGTARVSSWGMSFLPTTDGQSFVGAVSNGNVSTSATTYMPTVNVSGSPSTTESWGMLQACTLLGLFAQTSVSPGVSPKAYTFTARNNSTNTAATFAINDASSTPNDLTSGRVGNITGQSITVADDDLLSTSIAPASTPIGLHVYISMLISMGGATVYTQSLTASMTPTGALARSTNHNLSASVTINGNLSKSLSRTMTAALTITGTLNRVLSRMLTASASFSGILARLTGRNLSASATPAGNLNRTTARTLTASTTPSGSLFKRLARLLTASSTPTGSLTSSRLRMSTLTASTTPTGALSRTTNKSLAANTTPAGSLSKSIAKTFSASVSVTGSLAKRLARALTGSVSFIGNLAKGSFHGLTFTASTTPTGSLTKQNNKGLTASTTPTGNLNKQTARSLAGNVNVTGSLSKRLFRSFAGSVSSVGNLLRRTNRTMTASSTPTGTLSKSTQRSLAGSNAPVGSLKKQTNKTLAGSETPTGSLSRRISRLFGGSHTPSGRLTKTIAKTFTANVTIVGTFFKAIVSILVNPSRPIVLGARRAISLLASKAGIINLDNQKDGIKLKNNEPGPSAPDQDNNNVNLK